MGARCFIAWGLSGKWAVDLRLDWFGAACSHAHMPCHASDAEAHYSSLAAVAVMKLWKERFSLFGVTCEVRSRPCPTAVWFVTVTRFCAAVVRVCAANLAPAFAHIHSHPALKLLRGFLRRRRISRLHSMHFV